MLSAGGRWPSGGKLAHRTRNLVAKAKETSADKLNRPVSKYFPTGISALSVPLWVFVVALALRQPLPPCWSCPLAPGFHSDKVPHSEALHYTAKGRKNQEETLNEEPQRVLVSSQRV